MITLLNLSSRQPWRRGVATARTSLRTVVGKVLGLCLCATLLSGCEDPFSVPRIVEKSVELVSGDGQKGKAGEYLGQGLTIRVTDTNGDGVGNIRVDWTVHSGFGTFFVWEGWFPEEVTSYRMITEWDGVSSTAYRPAVLGTHVVRAAAYDQLGTVGVIDFVVDVDVIVIRVVDGGALQDEDELSFTCLAICLAGPAGEEATHVSVPMGTSLEWVNRTAHAGFELRSTGGPDGAPSFSATLEPEERFVFTPTMPGSWQYQTAHAGAIDGAKGTIVVAPDG